MKRFLFLLALVGLSTCAFKPAFADPPVSQSNGAATLTVNARLVDAAPYTTYYVSPAPGATTSVEVHSVHYAEYVNAIYPVVNLPLHWYFRSGVTGITPDQVDSGTDNATLAANVRWEKSVYLPASPNSYSLPASHYDGVASSTLNDSVSYPYAGVTAPFDVYVGYAGP